MLMSCAAVTRASPPAPGERISKRQVLPRLGVARIVAHGVGQHVYCARMIAGKRKAEPEIGGADLALQRIEFLARVVFAALRDLDQRKVECRTVERGIDIERVLETGLGRIDTACGKICLAQHMAIFGAARQRVDGAFGGGYRACVLTGGKRRVCIGSSVAGNARRIRLFGRGALRNRDLHERREAGERGRDGQRRGS